MSIAPEIMSPRERGYFTPILWEPQPSLEDRADEWSFLRERFQAVREGDFTALDDLPGRYPALEDRAARVFARNLLGDAGTDEQLEAVEEYVREEVLAAERACELCHALGLWGRLSAAEPILVAYDRNFPAQYAEGLPAYLTTMLEADAGPVARPPTKDDDDEFAAYEQCVGEALRRQVEAFGTDRAYVQLGEEFGVERTARQLHARLGADRRHTMMRPFLRQRFEASTGIDCSYFYEKSDARPLTIAAGLEEWLESPKPAAFAAGQRYFFGHWIPRRSVS